MYNTRVKRKNMVWLTVWLLLLVAAFAADQPVKQRLYARSFHDESAQVMKGMWYATAVKSLGDVRAVLVLGVALIAAKWLDWRRAVVMVLCASTAIASDVIKWVAGRQRPIGKDGLLTPLFDFSPFVRPPAGFAFPSGHTMLAFATASCLAVYYPRWRYVFFGLAVLVGLERIAELAHHVSDVVAGAGLGILLGQLVLRSLEKWVSGVNGTALAGHLED